MGFLSRLHKVATGVGGALQAPLGLVKDLAQAPFKDEDEYDGLVNTLYRRSVARGGQMFGNLIGPDEGLGAVIGGVPGVVRSPVGAVTGGVLSGLETVYREGIAEPVAAALTVGSLADAPGGGGVGGLFRGSNWREGYRIAQDRSPGQALALMFGTEDILDDAEVARFAATNTYEIMSGTADAVLRLTRDPSVGLGKAFTAARTKALVRPIESAADINRAMGSGRVDRFREALQGKTPAEIRNQFFPDHRSGDVISTVLAEAVDKGEDASALRLLMGDTEQLAGIHQRQAGLAGKIDRLTAERNELLRWDDGSLFAEPGRAAALQDEIASLYPEVERTARLEAAWGRLNEVPRVTLAGRVRASTFYQESPLARPLHVVADMAPQRLVNLHDQSGDVQMARNLRRSELPREAQDTYRTRYMAAMNPGQRQAVLVAAEEAAVRSIAERAGMGVDDIEKVLGSARRGRQGAAQVLKSRVYDGEGRSKVMLPDEGGVYRETHLPMWATQEANILPMVDLDAVKEAASAWGRWRLRHPSTEAPREIAERFYKVWRPAVLLRPAWPVRIVMDEQLRIIAKIGALAQMRNLGSSVANNASDLLARVPKEQRGLRGWTYRNHEMEGAFGVPGDSANVYKALNSANSSFDELIGQGETRILEELRANTGEWRSIAPDAPEHGQSWEKAVNLQIGQDAMGRRMLAGESVDATVRWLEATPEGQAYAARNTLRGKMPRRWVESNADQVTAYLPTEELRTLALSRKATVDDLVRALPNAAERPVVHGEILAQGFGGSTISRGFNGLIRGAFDKLGRAPTDVLSRNPFFDHVYRAEARRLVDLADEQGAVLDDAFLRRIEGQAREHALGESRNLLYDLAEKSELAETARFFMPFYSAWQEVITRWAGLAVENPAFVARMRLVWDAPEKAGVVYDENGNRITADGKAVNTLGKEVEAGSTRYIRIKVPEWAKDVPGFKALDTQGAVQFDKTGFNLAMQGYPGSGPLVQIPVNEIVKNRPDLEKSLDFVLPFGANQELRDMLLPAAWKRLATRNAGEDDRAYSNTVMRIWQAKAVDYNLGKRDDAPTWEEATKEADAFFSLRTVASATLPAAPTFLSPYQAFIDAYRQLREEDPETADGRFLDLYGADYFPLTQSLSRSMDGVPPTLEGWKARSKYKDLIEAAPELGALIVGAEGAGEFNGAVYAAQFAERVAPGSKERQREGRSFEEFTTAPGVRLGWIEYGKAMDLIDATRIQRGLPNLQVKAAQDLALFKRAVTEKLAARHPDWYADFTVVDNAKWQKRIAGMRGIVADSRLAQRDDMKGLAEYLKLRDSVAAALSTRKAKSLTASGNRDLALLWETMTGKLVEQNLAFGALYHRYLEGDPLVE